MKNMIDIKDIRKIYFIGIGGIGMSSLARYFKFHGKLVSGYDRTETALTRKLSEEGISVHYVDDPSLAPKDADLVVYTPAIPREHQELNFYSGNDYQIMKRSEVLGLITNSSFNICVAGTHGKTTVTTMIAHLLRDSGYGCNAFLGGISVNYNSNFWSNDRNVCVIEADEYDRSFLKLSPDIAVITAMDADHLDIYGTAEAVEAAFIAFSERLKKGGYLLTRFGLKRASDFRTENHQTYSIRVSGADICTTEIRVQNGIYVFDVRAPDWTLERLQLPMGGLHNVENMTAAVAVAKRLRIEDKKIKEAVLSFKGVKRRFEYIIKPDSEERKKSNAVFIDDYAHHPEELRALIQGAKALFPDRQCILIFQPHLYSRTKDFAQGFADSLDMADQLILLPIYPAREIPIAGVSSKIILDKMKKSNGLLMGKNELLDWIAENVGLIRKNLIITAGAGDIDAMVEPIKELIEKKY
jgi:UDP-N-acetylmuramate--alanine ligase